MLLDNTDYPLFPTDSFYMENNVRMQLHKGKNMKTFAT
jgi:hypothetical protein